MNRRLLFLPFAAFVALSGYIGWQMGQPLSETDVLDFYAAQWVETGPAGASTADCLGLPGEKPEVWMTVICTHDNGTTQRTSVARNGRVIANQQGPEA